MAAIQAANDGEWLPDKSKDTNRPWSLKKYRVYTETAVYMGTTEKPIHMDAVVAETMGCVNLTDMIARTPKRIDMIGGPLRGKLFESLAAKYL